MEGDFGRFVGNVLRVKSKRGRPPVLSAQAFYPMREERELQALLRGELLRSWTASVAEQLERFSDEDASEPFGDGFMEKVWKIADAIIVNAQQSLVKFSEMTIGVPYYPPAVSESVKKDWGDTFQKLCISADTQGKADIATAIYTAKSEGKNKYQVEHEVEQFLPAKTRHRAELIARTETGKLNNAATMATYESAGIRYYRWLATTDERTRPTHAAMNDLICAVGDPDHYYEETPEGLEKKGRTAGMYHGDPGTDFQCRCTSVPWDPRIHGKYDVKEVPEPPEKTPSKLEQARAETEAAEQRVQEAERKLRLMTAAVKRHAERTPERVAEIRKLWDDRERKRRIAAISAERHEKRTNEQASEIQKKWDARQAEIKESIKNVAEIRKEYSGIKGMPFPSTVKKAENGAKYTKAAALAEKFRQKVDAEAAKMDLLDNPLESMKKHGLKETQAVQEAVRKKLESFANLDIDTRIKKLEFEIGWVENSKKYSTWEVAKKAYEKALVAAKFQKAVDDATAKIQALETTAKSAKDKTLTGYVNKLKKAGTPTTQAELDALAKEIDKAEKRAAKVKPKEPSPSDVYPEISFKPSTAKQRSIPFIDSSKWRAKDAEIIDSCAKAAWQSATLEQKQAAYYYTQGSKVNNEPLYGAKYSGPKSVKEAVTKHNPNLTRLIDNTSLPKDTWLRSGQEWGTFSGVFGIDLEAEIKMLDNGKRSKDDIAKELTKKLKGKTGTQKAFMSTSFASNTGFKETLDFQIFAQKGTKCLYAEPFSHFGVRDTSPTKWDGKEDTISLGKAKEFEGILQRGTEFRINKITFDLSKRTDSGWSIELEIVKQAPQPYRPGNPVIY